MKKYSKVLFVALFIFTAMLITGCGGNKDNDLKDAAGTYKGTYVKLVGDDTKTEEEFSLVLKEDGTGTHNRNDYSFKVEWTLDGEKFTMKETFIGDPINYTGTLKDGNLQIYNGDPKDIWTYEYNYVKE